PRHRAARARAGAHAQPRTTGKLPCADAARVAEIRPTLRRGLHLRAGRGRGLRHHASADPPGRGGRQPRLWPGRRPDLVRRRDPGDCAAARLARPAAPCARDQARTAEVVHLFRRVGVHRADVRLHGIYSRAGLGGDADPAAASRAALLAGAPAQSAPRVLRRQDSARHGAVARRGAGALARHRARAVAAGAAAAGGSGRPLALAMTVSRRRDGDRTQFRPQNAKPSMLSAAVCARIVEAKDMRPSPILRACFVAAALTAWSLADLARAQEADSAADEETTELPAGEPLDLTTPDLGNTKPRALSSFKPLAPAWQGQAGIDRRNPAFPAAEFQPGPLVDSPLTDQSTGAAWAKVTVPGVDAPLGWDKTVIDTRVDPAQEESRLGTTLSRSMPMDENFSLTLQNG